MPIPINYQQSGVLCSEIGDFVQAKKERILKVSKAVGKIEQGYVGRRNLQTPRWLWKYKELGNKSYFVTLPCDLGHPKSQLLYVYNEVLNANTLCCCRYIIILYWPKGSLGFSIASYGKI